MCIFNDKHTLPLLIPMHIIIPYMFQLPLDGRIFIETKLCGSDGYSD